MPETRTKLGVGYRPELALAIERRTDLAFVEVTAEDYRSPRDVPRALKNLQKKGVEVLVHSLSLSLGQAPSECSERGGARLILGGAKNNFSRQHKMFLRQLKHLDELARYFEAPFVSDHIAFVRAGELESGHLLPLERSEAMLAVLRENIAMAKDKLSVPLVLENIASTFDQPFAEMNEATFVRRVVEGNDCGLLLDLSNLFANSHNMQFCASDYLRSLPLERLQYVHLAGGTFKRGLYHDTHCHPLKEQSIELLKELAQLTHLPRVMLERDDSFPPEDEFNAELDAIAAAAVSNSKQELSSPAAAISKQELSSPAAAISKQELSSPAAAISKQELFSPAAAISKQELSSPAAAISNQDLLPLIGPVSNDQLSRPEWAGSIQDLPRPFASINNPSVRAELDACELDDAIAKRQKELTRSLLGLTDAPVGFDKTSIEEASRALIRKRLRTVKRAHPCLADSQKDTDLMRYFHDFPSVPPEGPYADGQAFFRWQKSLSRV